MSETTGTNVPAPRREESVSVERSVEAAVRVRVGYAGFWRRALAFVIDMVILGSVQGALAFGVLSMRPGDLGALVNVYIVSSLVAWAYFALMESSPLRATVGKLAIGIWVGDVQSDPISFTRASFRYWFKSLSAWSLALGYLIAAFTPRKQALHDLLAGTLVLRAIPQTVDTATMSLPTERWNGTTWVRSGSQTEAS
jgi:uncharacterized RDD family membrane protein YckC